ncbi:MAG: phage tail tape measure protein [Pseudomonadota bacterium]
MTDLEDGARRTGDVVTELEGALNATESVASAFRAEMERTRESFSRTSREAQGLSRTLGSSMRSAFDGLIFDGEKVSNVLRDVGRQLASTVLNQALQPVQNAAGGLVTGLVNSGVSSLFGAVTPFANGGVFSSGQVRAFASGGIVEGPTTFPMRGGVGLMGEAGPEAIMPLTRGADGKLGVRARAGGAVHVTMNVSTPDVEGFRRSGAQVAANVRRAIARGQRNL